MADGVRLAVNLLTRGGDWKTHRSPVILEYLPYRKDDWSIERDLGLHSYWVQQGYVVARVDIRGTGRSEGELPDREYSEEELKDGEAVIAWLAAQNWSNGSVGMMGISWGGFNSIQMAMRQPPALKAIIAVDATEDLFKDDIHYIDGLMHADEYELSMDLQPAMTRPPDFPIDESSLRARFDAKPWFPIYLEHQRGGPFWDRASLRPDYSRIKIPVFVVGGFYDGYRDNVPRMLEHLSGPRMGLIGPWNHTFPHDADPGPEIEWRALAIRWWDHWLKGEENGVEREPMLTAYVRHSYPPSLSLKEIPGEWQSFVSWPAPEVQSSHWFLTPQHGLVSTPSPVGRSCAGVCAFGRRRGRFLVGRANSGSEATGCDELELRFGTPGAGSGDIGRAGGQAGCFRLCSTGGLDGTARGCWPRRSCHYGYGRCTERRSAGFDA